MSIDLSDSKASQDQFLVEANRRVLFRYIYAPYDNFNVLRAINRDTKIHDTVFIYFKYVFLLFVKICMKLENMSNTLLKHSYLTFLINNHVSVTDLVFINAFVIHSKQFMIDNTVKNKTK